MLDLTHHPLEPEKPIPVYPADIVPGVDGCPLCGSTYRRCNPKFFGTDMRSKLNNDGTIDVMYSTSWRKQSCGRDAATFSIQNVLRNLKPKTRALYQETCPDYSSILEALTTGRMYTHAASKALEVAMGKRVWAKPHPNYRTINHAYTGSEDGFILLKTPRLPGSAPSKLFFGEFLCNKWCDTCSVNVGDPETVPLKRFWVDRNEFLQGTIDWRPEACVRNCTGKPDYCALGHLVKWRFEAITAPPIILVLQMGFAKDQANAKPKVDDVPGGYLEFGGRFYKVSGCTYGDGGHFMAVGEAFDTCMKYVGDGMENNGRWIEYHSALFPTSWGRKVLNDIIYVQVDHIISKHA